MKKFISLFCVLLVLFICKLSFVSMALSCAPPKSIQDEYKASTAVFMGTALNSNSEAPVNFQIKTIWKGSLDTFPKGVFIGNMWMDIEEGQDYLIFASIREGRLEGNICGNSKHWSKTVQVQMDEFGIGQLSKQPVIEQPLVEQNLAEKGVNGEKVFWLLGIVFLVICGFFAVFYVFGKLRSRK